ncbi:GRB10-interacting GYF protein 1 isoform X6 [Buteo buteo]|uniref:GRB10-interacting GYF protein 1 isoform X6 n=1 Tax=Buteo buteo TaxID=30397 RepID=UPI003EC0CB5F
MAAETLNFGPEWLRALSGGGGGVSVVTSPPLSPALPRYRLAENRYGREEMLALYVPGDKAPQEIQEREFAAIAQEEPLPPLALLPLTQEEQRNFSLSVNSVAVLRLMGRTGGGPAAGGPRGRAGTRSRGVSGALRSPHGATEKPPPAPLPEDPETAPSESGIPQPPEGPLPAPPKDPPEELPLPPEPPPATTEDAPTPPAEDPSVRVPPPTSDAEDEEGMKHLQQEAEKLVASLQEPSLEEEAFGGGRAPPRLPDPLPLAHQAARKWFYKDPQGEIQGPFSPQEMGEWFQAGYFPMALLVKRGCDEVFQPLGDVIKMWGRVPFAPGPSPPPLLGNLDQERLKKQQELAAAAALYQQLQQQQFLQLLGRQPPSPCPVPPKSGELTPQQLRSLLQELQALKPRQGEPNLLRSLSVPEATPLWDPSQPPGSDSGLWELPLGSPPPSPILEQLQLQLKLQELRAWREDDQRKRRQEEELLRRKQCRQQEVLLKLLQQSGGPGGAPQNWALPKAPPTPDGERPPHKAQRGARAVGTPWGPELWPLPKKNPPAWEESGARGGSCAVEGVAARAATVPPPQGGVAGGGAAARPPIRPRGKATPPGGGWGGEGQTAPPAAAAQRPQHPGLLAAWPWG